VTARSTILALVATLVAGTAVAGSLSAARAGSENRTFSKAVADSACASSEQKLERIDALLDEQPYGPQAERLRRMKTQLNEQRQSLNCKQSIR